jgi:peptidoglycan hydrolase CwlO-like protein
MKPIPALFAALIMTGIVGLAMLGIGANALLNHNTQPTLNSASAASSSTVSNVASSSSQVQQLQARISEYQAREQQYQSQLQSLEQQVGQEQQQVQIFQQILGELQARGVIAIQGDGTILIPRR